MNHTISVLVPVFNTERYLRQCLDSLMVQTLGDMQIICINDGSTDSSPAIIDEYADKHPSIKVISKTNTGYGHSMNCGLDAADGAYVGIVEPDDFAEPFMFDYLYRKAVRHDLDVVKADYFEYAESGRRRRGNFSGFKKGRVFDTIDQPGVMGTDPAIWSGIYRREMLEREKIRFLETPGASFQDVGFSYKTWLVARRCMVLRRPCLNYRVDNAASSVKSAAKVFCVCEEHESVDAFAQCRLDDRMRALMQSVQQARFGTYRWNYNRIAPDQRFPFARRVAAEYDEARQRGFLVEASFRPQNWRLLQELMANPEAFCAAHTDDLPWEF